MNVKRIILGCAAALLSCVAIAQYAYSITPSGTDTTDQNSITKIGYSQVSLETGITAFAGGGQTSAYQLTNAYSRVTTVATAADSVKLPAICNTTNVGLQLWVSNAAASNAMNVFPATGDAINL